MPIVPLLAAFAAPLVASVASWAIARIASEGGVGAVGGFLRWLVYLWPALAVIPTAVMIFIWSPAKATFPGHDFYSVAAEVIPLLLIALMVERTLIAALPRTIYIEFAAMLLIGEIAALLAVSEIFGSEASVGGRYAGTGVLATLTAGGLLAGGMLVAAAAILRNEPAATEAVGAEP